MAYKKGYCTQCGAQVLVRDVSGKWNARKPNFTQIVLSFGDGSRTTALPICKDCSVAPDYQVLMGSLLADDSDAGSSKTALQSKGLPTQHIIKG